MNIRVDLNTPIKDGTEVVFRSPVDCSQITGLIVYFKENGITSSQEFALADAHGNNVGDIDHLFAENVVVKVILDVAHSMAFVQNADTNAYLEGRFDDIIDKLCPSFEKTGTVVQCEPLEGTSLVIYGIEVPGTHDITVCGKNLYDFSEENLNVGYVHMQSGVIVASSTAYRHTKKIPVCHLVGKTLTLNKTPGGTNPGTCFYRKDDTLCGNGKGTALVVPDEAAYMCVTVNLSDVNAGGIQLEIGSEATVYEPFTVYGTGTLVAPGESIVIAASRGINTVYGLDESTGDVAVLNVIGKADPVALIDKLTEAVRSLGGDI